MLITAMNTPFYDTKQDDEWSDANEDVACANIITQYTGRKGAGNIVHQHEGIEFGARMPLEAFLTLFISIFGLGGWRMTMMTPKNPEWTSWLFQIVYMLYMMVTTIVLINLLIAMMSDTYQRIQQQSDMEWKFGLAKLIRSMARTEMSPSPINLVTTWIIYIGSLIRTARKKRVDDYSKMVNSPSDGKSGSMKKNGKEENGAALKIPET